MSQIRRVQVHAATKDRMRVGLEAMIVVQSGVLTRGEVDALRSVVADKLMVLMTELPYLNVPLSSIKVKR